jgi:hypothetical protein
LGLAVKTRLPILLELDPANRPQPSWGQFCSLDESSEGAAVPRWRVTVASGSARQKLRASRCPQACGEWVERLSWENWPGFSGSSRSVRGRTRPGMRRLEATREVQATRHVEANRYSRSPMCAGSATGS